MAEPITSCDTPPVIHVCLTCRDGGEALHEALLQQATTAGVRVEGVKCLAACQRGCTATLSMPGKWSWLLGGLRPELAEDLMVYAKAYEHSRSGTVMPSKRPESLRDIILGRFPGQLSPSGEPLQPAAPAQPAASERLS
ncbi:MULTISPECIES: DUF1636 domain-containing protein [Asaia]|uniref:DUF1636 domain-containing protein n=1 Tax=Asaia TaxID=91914 RepID=UPI00255288C9|nr:DUF1636 domain-containing protein [Asaia sp. HumB]MDL2171601.1 DUF1636 domain-containing protein [Asaia sp. HumB]